MELAARIRSRAVSGGLRQQRQTERAPRARFLQHLRGEISATAALARATRTARQLSHAAYAFGGRLADHRVGDGVADADVHAGTQWIGGTI